MSMNAEIKAQWIADLRSGQYVQGQNYLNAGGKLCCLGVLCEQAVRAGVIESRLDEAYGVVFYDGKEDILTETVRNWAGLPDDNPHPNNPAIMVNGESVTLAELNDGEDGWNRRTFDQIADLIDAQL